MADKSIEVKVREWLEKSGYPLEMQVAREFRRAQFRVSQAQFYLDPESHQYREIDVVASRSESVDGRIIQIQFVVECKVSRDRPWMMFVGEDRPREHFNPVSRIMFGPCNKAGVVLRGVLSSAKDLHGLPLFMDDRQTAYGVVQAFKDGREDASFAAVMQVGKAATVLANEPLFGGLNLGLKKTPATIAFPVIVLDGRLFEAGLDQSGQVVVKETYQCTLVNRNPQLGAALALIPVVAKEALADFVAGTATTCNEILRWCKGNSAIMEDTFEQMAKSV
jgi:hypothetical protein